MNRSMNRSLMIITIIAMLSIVLAACGTPAPAPVATAVSAAKETAAPVAATAVSAVKATAAPVATAVAAATGKPKIGISMSDFATERWKPESDLLKSLLEAKGYEVLVQEANHDVKLQNDQIDNMLSQGVKGLIIVAEDGDAAATAVQKANKAGVKVIAYDRLIKDPAIAGYLSFDNTEVGRNEADGVMKWLDKNFDFSKGPAKVMMMGGSPTDNNAILVRGGQEEVVKPYIDAGKVEVVADQWVDNWDAANALKIMENVLTAQANKIDAVVASNDGTALGALQALKAQGLAGKVPISGQDATADGCNSIAKGEQTVTVLKDIRNLAPAAVEMMDALVKGEAYSNLKSFTLAELTNDKTKQGNIMAYFLPVEQVNKDNVYEKCVKNGFQPYDAVYRDVPADQKPDPNTGKLPSNGIKVGISMSDFATERWKPESDLLKSLLEAKGYEVLVQEANHDVKLQNDQIDNMLSQGVKGLIIVAEDGDAAATAVQKANKAGVKVIAYDRLIKDPAIAGYLSFDNTEVGRNEADGVMKWLDKNFDFSKGPAKVMMMGGSPTDNNAILVRGGQEEVVKPYIDAGKVEVVADQWVDNWDAANALKIMENVLTAQANKIDAVVASNDGTALGALQALKAQGLAGKVPISGQDATADGCNSIAKGEQTVTVLKDIRNLAPAAVDMMDALIKGEAYSKLKSFTLAELTNDKTQAGQYHGLLPARGAGQQGQCVREVREERLPAIRCCVS